MPVDISLSIFQRITLQGTLSICVLGMCMRAREAVTT